MESCCGSIFRVLGERSRKEIGIGGRGRYDSGPFVAGMTANWQLASSRQAPPFGGLPLCWRRRYTTPCVEQAAIDSQSGFTGLLSDHAYLELSEVRDIQNSVGTSKKRDRSPARRLDHLSGPVPALCAPFYNLPWQAQDKSSPQL